jgi:hypothetical protein
MPLVVWTLFNGSRVTYLPPAERYGLGIYQELVAVLTAGSLERLVDEIGRALTALGAT